VIDTKITDIGDIDVAEGDIALTGRTTSDKDVASCIAQMARMALSTERGDLLLHASLGNELAKLIGLPNKKSTAALGIQIIKSALISWGVSNKVTIESWPPDLNTLAFDVHISLGPSGKELSFILKQTLNIAS
jgi:hypothetical protein